jgi:hypothetical protein
MRIYKHKYIGYYYTVHDNRVIFSNNLGDVLYKNLNCLVSIQFEPTDLYDKNIFTVCKPITDALRSKFQ